MLCVYGSVTRSPFLGNCTAATVELTLGFVVLVNVPVTKVPVTPCTYILAVDPVVITVRIVPVPPEDTTSPF